MKTLFSTLLVLAFSVPLAPVQAQVLERTPYTQAELDQMLAPIALYPDALLSQVLMASTYPLDVVQAARWAREHPGLQGDEAVRAVVDKDWDASVKSLLAFPRLLARMDEQLEWTKRLGDAFLGQEPHVMETVQQLRRKARVAGQLTPDERQRIGDDGGNIVIESADPRVVYVPYYDPWVVYGPWWWSAYPPIAWAPWSGYTAYRPGIWWGVGVGISAGFFFGGVDWRHRHVQVIHANNYYVRPRGYAPRRAQNIGKWQHDSWHRRGLERRTVQRRGEIRAHPMPPALRASSPQPRMQAQSRNQAQPRTQSQPRIQAQPRTQSPPRIQAQPRTQSRPRIQAQPRTQSPPRIQAQPRTQSQPRIQAQPRTRSQPRIGAPQAQPQAESRRQTRGEMRGGGNDGKRNGGWRGKFGRGSGRN